MSHGTEPSFGLSDNYVFLEDGGRAPVVAVDGAFWADLMCGSPQTPGARLVANGDGWLTGIMRWDGRSRGWEMHPNGDELLYLISGAVDVSIEEASEVRLVSLVPGQGCVVPRGAWHKHFAHVESHVFACTYGKGTLHRPL